MEYETSYDTGLKPFNHDKNRGKWASSKDFFFVCAGHAFKADAIVFIPVFLFEYIGVYMLIPYLVVLAVCVVPIVFIQSFLGQFSSTGYISVFRIAPLFKGIGYVSLVFNFAALTFYSILSAIPLFYFFNSLRPTIPWSCEGTAEFEEEHNYTYLICTKGDGDGKRAIPSVVFLGDHFEESLVSWQLMVCTCIIWGIIGFVLLKPTEFIGRFMKYSFLTVVAIMCICLVRCIFLPGAIDGIWEFLYPKRPGQHWTIIILVPCMALSTLGPGWGSILTMASYNDFKVNIFKYSWVMCLAQLGLIFGMTFLSIFVSHFMRSIRRRSVGLFNTDQIWLELFKVPTGLTFLEWPHLWNLLFFSMLVLGTFNLLVIQLFSLLTSLFDEFEVLREKKRQTVLKTVGSLGLISMIFCTIHGLRLFEILTIASNVIQIVLNLLVLVVVLYVYGRERFQRDLNFMTSSFYPTWMINIIRIVAPILILLALIAAFVFMLFSMYHRNISLIGWVLIVFAILSLILSWFLVPGYCIVRLKQTTGRIGVRFKSSVKPNDWYPADPHYKQRYEESLNSTEMSHNLVTEIIE